MVLQMNNYRTYEELAKLGTFDERFRYLMLNSKVGFETFGENRRLNQEFYASDIWKEVRRFVIMRDYGCDLGVLGNDIQGAAYVHHMNPVTVDDVINRTDILLDGGRRAIPDYFGATAPTANLGEIESEGYEFELRWNKVLGDWRIWGNASLTHAESKVIEADEPMLKPAYQKEQGKAINQTYSYVDKGFYNTWDELYGSTAHDTNDQYRLPGNYIILDYDADGVITQNDQVPYGYTGIPQNSMNAQFGVDWKGWSFFVQFYGVNNVTRYVNLASFEEFRNISYYEGSYWSKYNTNADVSLPRWGALQSRYTQGTRYLYDGSYLRLKYAELAYTFNRSSWIKKLGMNSLRVYVNGNNLFLWSSMPDDRESNSGDGSAYPTQRRVNVGFRLTL